MAFRKFEEIKVWQEGRELVRVVYALTKGGEFCKDWGLRDQVQRAAISITSNVAEGYARRGNKEFVKFLWIAKGSAAEVQSQFYNALDLCYITDEDFQSVYSKAESIQIHLYHLIQTLSQSPTQQKNVRTRNCPDTPQSS